MTHSVRSSPMFRTNSSKAAVTLLLACASAACGTANSGDDAAADGSGPLDAASTVDGTNATDTADALDGTTGQDAMRDAGNPALTMPVSLGTAGNFAILAKSGISTVPASSVTGDLGIS